VLQRLKILFVIDYFHRTGGTEQHLCQLVSRLADKGVQSSVVVFHLGHSELIDRIRTAGIEVTQFPVAREYTPAAAWQAARLLRYIRANHFDIVQTFHQKSDTYGALIARLAGVKHIVSSKRDIGQLKKRAHFFVNSRLGWLFDRVIAVCGAVEDVVAAKEAVPRTKLMRIYNGVDIERFRPSSGAERTAARARLGLNEDDFVVGMVAGFRPEKSYDVFFEGALRALGDLDHARVLAVGGGPLLEPMRARFNAEERRGRVLFSGPIGNVLEWLQAMDVACLVPGSNEGFSNAVLEKMAMGLPVVVTNVGGNAEAISHRRDGIVIEPGDSAALTRAIQELHDDPPLRRWLGSNARKRVETEFTLERMVSMHLDLYRSLVTRRSSRT
jgi:glycosyltransferase involved in cell wall biosynthesis